MDRRFLCTLVCCALILSLFYLPIPVGAGKFEKPIRIVLEKTGLDKVLGKIGADVLKKGNVIVGTLLGKFEKIHKNVEKGVLWLKHHKGEVLGGLTLAEIAYDKSTHVATFIEKDNNNDYFVQFIPDDKNNRYNIYVNDEICGVLPYEIIKNCSEEKIAEKFADARKSTIEEYKRRHQ